MLPIECNPRIHTAITLLASLPGPELANSYFDLDKNQLENIQFPIHPLPDQAPISWIAHALPLALAGVLPPQISGQLHPAMAIESNKNDFLISPPMKSGFFSTLLAYAIGSEKDAVFDKNDLLPFWCLAHVHWTWLLLRQVRNGRGWTRANVSTSRIFES